jgi:hypothetical protein
MNQFNRILVVVAAALIVPAVLLMLDGQILGEMTTNLSRVLLITAIPVIAKSRKSKAIADAQSVNQYPGSKGPFFPLNTFFFMEFIPLSIYRA